MYNYNNTFLCVGVIPTHVYSTLSAVVKIQGSDTSANFKKTKHNTAATCTRSKFIIHVHVHVHVVHELSKINF